MAATMKVATKAVAIRPATKAAKAPVAAPAQRMMVWQPINNKFFETFSYLPPLDDTQIAKQVDYIVGQGWTPCLEVADAANAYISNVNTTRINNTTSLYYDNRYWTMWKLPMFGCTDASQVLKEVAAATKAFPESYVRLAAFDAVRQVQTASMLVHRPPNSGEWKTPEKRQVA